MFSTDDTIVAIATPPGRGAIGVVRLSGPAALSIAAGMTGRSGFDERRATTTRLTAGDLRDTVVITAFLTPASYTGDDVVEISAHGSAVVLRAIVSAAVAAGARLAAPGEFTLRAFLNGKIDLAQAEAIADLIDAATPLQARAAFDQLSGTLSERVSRIDAMLFDLMARLEASVDFPDEGYRFIAPDQVRASLTQLAGEIDAILASATRGRLIREGAQVVLAGEPNVGKSSLFNALVGSHRAIVTDVAGTTRDLVTEVVDVRGLRVTLVDTAGLTESSDPVEREGIARTRGALTVADLVLCVADNDTALARARQAARAVEPSRVLAVASKCDVSPDWSPMDAVRVSSVSGAGLETLLDRIYERLTAGEATTDTPAISNIRHVNLLTQARAVLTTVISGIEERGAELSEEFVLADLQQARALLESVNGQRSADDTLIHIFERFCVGK